jgi:RNA polymerase sigma factor (sigma-70 family)
MDALSSGEDGQPDDPGCPSDPLSQSYVQLQQMKYPNRYGKCMRDSELVASIVAGDPEGLAAAYDRYSGPLFGYCQSLLRDPDDAADAVQDTFVIAASKLGRLRDPERLRAWLFAVARNECLHRLKSRRAAAVVAEVPEQPDESVDVGGEAERAESRALIRAAVGGLNDGERDVINQLWHGLEIPEVAMALGVSRNHAHSLFSRARDQLEASVGVLVVGRSGRKDCAALDQLLHDWDGRLTAPLRRRVGRHIDRCSVCSDRRRRELRPAALLSVAPGALVGFALAGARGGPGLQLLAPPGLRAEVLHLATDHGARAVAFRAASRPGMRSFQLNGFPHQAHGARLGLVRIPHLPLAVVGGTAVAATATAVLAIVPHAHHAQAAGHRPVTAPGSGATPTAAASGTTPGSGQAGRLSAVGPSASRALTGPRATSPIGTASPAGGGTTSAPSGGPPTTGAAPTTPSTSTPAPIVSVTVSSPVLAGSLSVSPSTVSLSALVGGTLTLTANGGPVTWSIPEPTSLLGLLTVTPSSGTLAAGQSVTVHLSVSLLSALTTTLTVTPGNEIVNLLIGAL